MIFVGSLIVCGVFGFLFCFDFFGVVGCGGVGCFEEDRGFNSIKLN